MTVTRTAEAGAPDDRILPIVRVVAAIIVVILAVATWVLFFHPESTDRRFAWTIKPDMTARLMGVGYGSALYFYVRVLTGRRWHRVTLGFLPTTLFTWLMLSATLLHLDKFHHGTLPFALWLWIYVITVALVPGVWLLNRSHDPGTLEERDACIPRWARTLLAIAGGGLLVVVALLFAWPAGAIRVWPWTLTPLTSRTVAAFTSIPAAGWVVMAWDGRWSAAKILCETLLIGLVLLVVGVAPLLVGLRSVEAADLGLPAVGGATIAGVAALYVWMNRTSPWLRCGGRRGLRAGRTPPGSPRTRPSTAGSGCGAAG